MKIYHKNKKKQKKKKEFNITFQGRRNKRLQKKVQRVDPASFFLFFSLFFFGQLSFLSSLAASFLPFRSLFASLMPPLLFKNISTPPEKTTFPSMVPPQNRVQTLSLFKLSVFPLSKIMASPPFLLPLQVVLIAFFGSLRGLGSSVWKGRNVSWLWPQCDGMWAEAWETGELACELGGRELAKLCSSMEGTAGVTIWFGLLRGKKAWLLCLHGCLLQKRRPWPCFCMGKEKICGSWRVAGPSGSKWERKGSWSRLHTLLGLLLMGSLAYDGPIVTNWA